MHFHIWLDQGGGLLSNMYSLGGGGNFEYV